MRELKLVLADSDAQSLVFMPATTEAGASEPEEFFLAVTDELRALIADSDNDEATSADHVANPATDPAAAPVADRPEQDSAVDEDAGSEQPEDGLAAAFSELRESEAHAREEREKARVSEQHAEDVERVRKGFGTKPGSGRPHRSRIPMSPRIIQDRVRHGATIAELAEEADTDESRIEPYAWPILQERSRVAELARSAHPVIGEAASKNTLWEALASSFAAREENVSDTEWDAHQDQARQWVVTVSWTKVAAGQGNAHSATFGFEPSETGGEDLVHPLDSVARDLVDPRFSSPVRSVTPLHSVAPGAGAQEDQEDAPAEGPQDREVTHDPHDLFANTHPGQQQSRADEDEEFLQHPAEEQGKKKRRKAVTPHWEDVLLGVRTNPKKRR